MEIRQRRLESQVAIQNAQIERLQKELAIHREFLDMQFESFMSFIRERGGDVIEISGGEDGQDRQTGFFIPFKGNSKKGKFLQPDDRPPDNSSRNNHVLALGSNVKGEGGRGRGRPGGGGGGGGGGEDEEEIEGDEDEMRGEQENYHHDEQEEEEEEEEDNVMYPPPQAILGDDSPDQNSSSNNNINNNSNNGSGQPYANGHHHREGSPAAPVNLSNYHQDERGMKQEGGDGEMLEDDEGRGGYGSSADEDNLNEQSGGMMQHLHGGSNSNNNGVINGHHGNYEESGDEENEDETDELDYSNIPYLSQQSIARFPFAHFLDNDEAPNTMMNGDQSSSADDMEGGHPSMMNEYTTGGPRRRTSSATPVENQHVCRYCGKVFHWKQSWVIHERTHTGEKPYSCACGKAFSQKANMNTHAKQCKQAKAIHNGKTNIFEMKCSLCPKMFTSKKALDSHKLKSHPGSLTSVMINNSNNSNISRNLNHSSSPSVGQLNNTSNNSLMGQAYLSSSNTHLTMTRSSLLRKANNTHQAEMGQGNHQNAASSSAAAESFLQRTLASISSKLMGNGSNNSIGRSNLISSAVASGSSGGGVTHHPPGKAKHCRWCDKFFSRKTSLKIHERVHTGERPYACGYCGKTFTQKGSVKLHCQRVHNATYSNMTILNS